MESESEFIEFFLPCRLSIMLDRFGNFLAGFWAELAKKTPERKSAD
jgi:hypothetical protein